MCNLRVSGTAEELNEHVELCLKKVHVGWLGEFEFNSPVSNIALILSHRPRDR